MGLDFLNRICRVIHTDLKPENVLLCLTDEEIKQIVDKGQLSSKELYRDRLQLYREKYNLGPVEASEEEIVYCPPEKTELLKAKKADSDSDGEMS